MADDIYSNERTVYLQIMAGLMKGHRVYETNLLKQFRHHFRAFKGCLSLVLALLFPCRNIRLFVKISFVFKQNNKRNIVWIQCIEALDYFEGTTDYPLVHETSVHETKHVRGRYRIMISVVNEEYSMNCSRAR